MAPTELKPVDGELVAEGLYWCSIYWMNGTPPKGSVLRSEVTNPPHLGFGSCFVIDKGGKMVTLYCPYTMDTFQVSRRSLEFHSLRDISARWPFRREWHAKNFVEKWDQAVRHSWQKDFATAVVILRMLDLPIPETVVPEGVEVKASGGKEADDVLGLTKPVKRKSRKGQVLAFFWPETRSILEAMAEFGISRSNVLSQLYLLTKDHGIGYELKADKAIITMPAGCTDPFEPEEADSGQKAA